MNLLHRLLQWTKTAQAVVRTRPCLSLVGVLIWGLEVRISIYAH